MLVLTKDKRPILDRVTNVQSIKFVNKMNKSKNKTKNRRTASALKFHNFVANCSAVNSTNGSTSNEGSTNETTHCLKEEHGTKQITVSHWRKSNNSSLEQSLANLEPNSSSTLQSFNSVQPIQQSSGLQLSEPPLNSSSANQSTKTDQSDQEIKANKVSKAKSFSLLSNSNSLISRSDFTLTNQCTDPNRNFLIKNLIAGNSLQYFNGKQKHLNLKQSSTKANTSLPTRSSPTSSKAKSSNQLANQLNNKFKLNQLRGPQSGSQLGSSQLETQLNSQLGNKLNNQLINQLRNQLSRGLNDNQLIDQLNRRSTRNQFSESNLSSLNLRRSIDQLNLILNDSNLLKANESILSNLLIKDTSELHQSLLELNSNSDRPIDDRRCETTKDDCKFDKNKNDGNDVKINAKNEVKNDTTRQQTKSNRRKPIFVRRLIKVENDDDATDDDQSSDEQPLDLSLKRRKLSDHLNESTTSDLVLELDSKQANSSIDKQSTNDSD